MRDGLDIIDLLGHDWHHELWLSVNNLSLNLLAFLLCNWHLDNLNWLRGSKDSLLWLLLSNNGVGLLDSLLDKLLSLVEELKLSQFLLEELESAHLVDASEDEEKNDWAHGVHLWPVLDSILLVSILLVSHNICTVAVAMSLGISFQRFIPEGWSIDSVNLLLEVEWINFMVELMVVVVVLLIVFESLELVFKLMSLGVVLLLHILHDLSEVIWDLLVVSFVELNIDIIELLLEMLATGLVVSSSKVSLWCLSNVGSHVGNISLSFVVKSGQVIVGLNIFYSSLENSTLLPGENVEDEEDHEHEEMSVEHSFGDSRLLLLGSSKGNLSHSEEEERDNGGEEHHHPERFIENILNSAFSGLGDIRPAEAGVV